MKNKNIEKFLKLNFICFSLLLLLVFVVANFFINIMGDKYLLTEAEHYFADTLITEDYFNINTDYIHSIGGWLSVLDDDLKVIYTTNIEEVDSYTQHQLINLTRGEMLRNNEKIYASMKYFTERSGVERLGIVCIPAKNVHATTTISNTNYGTKNILLIYTGGLLLIIAGYILIVWALSHHMKKELTNPIYMIMEAFNRVSMGDYAIRVDFNSVTEFVEIKESFNSMVKRLFDIEEEKRIAYQQRQQMLMDIGHDLKTPITIIQGYSSVIIDGQIPEKRKEKCMQIINENATNMVELIELLLDYTRFDYAEYRIETKTCDLSEFLRRIVIEKLLLFEEKEICVVADIPEEKIEAEIDAKIFKRAIVNLLNNILQHNSSGISVLIQLTRNKEIIVADSGETIPDDIKNKIFEPFVCGDKARQIEKHNNGLGLSITKKIVEVHNGQIHLEQKWNEYTKAFIVQMQ